MTEDVKQDGGAAEHSVSAYLCAQGGHTVEVMEPSTGNVIAAVSLPKGAIVRLPAIVAAATTAQLSALKAENAALREALRLSCYAMRAPIDGWKGELEAKALSAIAALPPIIGGVDSAPRTPKIGDNDFKWQVGTVCVDGFGDTETVTAIDDNDISFPVKTDKGNCYTLLGRYYSNHASTADLVKVVLMPQDAALSPVPVGSEKPTEGTVETLTLDELYAEIAPDFVPPSGGE